MSGPGSPWRDASSAPVGTPAQAGEDQGEIEARWLLPDPGTLPAVGWRRLRWTEGRLAAIDALAPNEASQPLAVLPPLANAHDHARTFRSASLGAAGQPLESWLPYLGLLPGVDPYLCAATSLARSARQGVADVMVHYTRVQGTLPYVEEAAAVGRAAADIGIRIGFAVALRDRQPLAYGNENALLAGLPPELRAAVTDRLARPAPGIAEQLARVREVRDACANYPVTVQYGPNGVTWCSDALLAAVAQASADDGLPVHMHLLETRYQREWADAHLPDGIVTHLDTLGLLGPRLTVAHATWCRPDELELLAERGVTIAVNTGSNLALASGLAPLADMRRRGCRVALGLDGLALDQDDDALRELRLTHYLHRGTGFNADLGAQGLWNLARHHGRRAIHGPTVERRILAAGAAADFLTLDWQAIDDEALWPDAPPLPALLGRAHGGHIRDLVVDGRRVVSAGRLARVDEAALRAELLAATRAALSETNALRWRGQLDELGGYLAAWYRSGRHCATCG